MKTGDPVTVSDDLIDLRRYEHLAANPYGGKLDRALWASGDDDS